MSDVDLDMAAKRCATGAFYNSGQVCISVKRIYIHRNVYEAFVGKLTKATEAIIVGDPLDEMVDVGPLIDLQESKRIESWVDEARAAGAEILTGGKRNGAIYFPTIISGTKPTMKIIAEEVFGPVVSVIACDDLEEVLRLADSSEYGGCRRGYLLGILITQFRRLSTFILEEQLLTTLPYSGPIICPTAVIGRAVWDVRAFALRFMI
jgi:acyl-CoA reductase-like NAD-dependent aldehyde dehydrogenase